ncbi:MAG: tyrosine-type recombinase/integrase [Acidimicrobiales bacterium]
MPYLYSDADIAALMAATRQFRSPLRAATFETLVGLLAVTGLRIGEALRLDRDDVDLAEGVPRIRLSKFAKSREVPVHASTVDTFAAYARRHDHLCPRPAGPPFSSRPPAPCCIATRTSPGSTSSAEPASSLAPRGAGPGHMT